MTVYVEYELRCDGAGGPYNCDDVIFTLTAAEARQVARERGWVVGSPRGKDLCPKHQKVNER